MPFITSLVCVFSLVLAPWGQREKWEGCASCATSLKILGTLPFWFSWSVCVMLELAHPEGPGRAPMGSCCVFNPAPSLRDSTVVQSRWGFADAGGHCSFWGQKLRYGAGRCYPWGGLMSLGTSSGPPAALQLLIRVQQRSVTLLLHGDRMGPAARIPPCPPRHLQSAELNRLISIKKKNTEGREKEQQWQERERLSRALHKNDKLLLDIGQERKRVLLYLMILVS